MGNHSKLHVPYLYNLYWIWILLYCLATHAVNPFYATNAAWQEHVHDAKGKEKLTKYFKGKEKEGEWSELETVLLIFEKSCL